MVKICSSCGTRTADDQARFCNKCGCPFPQPPPEISTVPQQRQPPVSAVSRNTPGSMPRQARTTGKRSGNKKTGRTGPLPFKTLVTGKYLRLIYLAGAIVIILVSLLGINAGFSKTGSGAATISFTNTTALVENPSTSPLFWIGLLIFGNLVWRIFCELAAMVFRIYDTIRCAEEAGPDDAPEYHKEEASGYGAEEGGEYVECPHCSKIVPADQVRECEVCGVQGCSSCIRLMGLLKKKMTCRECFDNK
ncbi:MAG: DUF4282 domain-containing protein [Methanoregula sp.]